MAQPNLWSGLTSYLVVLFAAVYTCVVSGEDLSRGFNEKINWVKYEDGLKIAKDGNKPIMLLIHKSWCGACKALKPQIAASDEILKDSDNFVMINVQDDEEPNDQKYSPDGGYIPRILFMEPSGEVVTDLYNEGGSTEYKYYYPSAVHVHSGMQRAHKYFTQKQSAKTVDEL